MKAYVKFWHDTKNLDLVLEGETETEIAMLGLMKDRKPRWSEAHDSSGKSELIFEAGPPGKEGQR